MKRMNRMNRGSESDLVRSVDLDHEQLLVLQDRAGARARVLCGGVWLTEEGQPEDRFAHGGKELVVARRGRTVLEALGHTRIEIYQPPRHAAPWWPWRWEALSRAAPTVLVGGLAVVLSVLLGVGVPELLARGFQHAGSAGPVL